MKANAPEKIYIQSFNVSEEDAKFDKSKLFFDDIWLEEPELGQENIEYVRKDAFIDRACEFLKSYRQDTPDGIGYIAGIVNDKTIEDFKKYMEE